MGFVKKDDPFRLPLDTFTALTFDLIRFQKYNYLGKCFSLIEEFLAANDASVKYMLRNSFIPDLHSCLITCEWKDEVVDIFPELLNDEYMKYEGLCNIPNDYNQFTVYLN